MRRWLWLALLLVACSDRERDNPLDPGNPVTHGAVTGFRAAADADVLTLSWAAMDVDNLESYVVYRGTPDSAFAAYRTLPPGQTAFSDSGLAFDVPSEWAVQAQTATSTSGLSEIDTVVAGPHNFWLVDRYRGNISRISYDGRDILLQATLSYPVALDFDPGSGLIWLADYLSQAAFSFTSGLEIISAVSLDGFPIDISADSSTGNAWVLCSSPDSVYEVSEAGVQRSISIPGNISLGSQLARDSESGLLWITTINEGAQDSLFSRQPNSIYQTKWNFEAVLPYTRQVESDIHSAAVWAATDSGVVWVHSIGIRYAYVNHLRVMGISVNPATGRCYYAGREPGSSLAEVGYIERGANPAVTVIFTGPWTSPGAIAALPGEDPTGFLLHQPLQERVLRFDRDGLLMGTLSGVDVQLNMIVEYDPDYVTE